jgi:GNAT superfamily N-acetyltransferase
MSSDMIHYHLASQADAAELARLRWAFRTELLPPSDPPTHTWEEFEPVMLAFLANAFASGEWAIWLAEDDGRILAHIYIYRIWKVPNPVEFNPAIGYVTNVYCIPEYRNQGVGGELMQIVQAWAQTIGLELLFLWPSKRSVPFYLREGFKQENEILEFLISEG